ncbi:MAG: DUF4184 family protein [Bacteroidota bacterium]
MHLSRRFLKSLILTGFKQDATNYRNTRPNSLLGEQIPILKILQHSSTLLEALVIAFAIYKLPINKTEEQNISLKYWSILSALSLTIVTVRLLSGLGF